MTYSRFSADGLVPLLFAVEPRVFENIACVDDEKMNCHHWQWTERQRRGAACVEALLGVVQSNFLGLE